MAHEEGEFIDLEFGIKPYKSQFLKDNPELRLTQEQLDDLISGITMDEADTTCELCGQLGDALRERIDVFSQGHQLPTALVIGVLEILKAEIMQETIGDDEND